MEIKIIEQKELPAMAVRKSASNADLGKEMSDAFEEIYGYVAKNGGQVCGAPYCAYLAETADGWDMEIGFPVAAPLPNAGNVYASKIPSGKCAVAQLKGSYSQLLNFWNEVYSEVIKRGFKPNGVPRDHYLNDPSQVSEEELLTDVVIPILST